MNSVQQLPALSSDQLERLRADIAAHGVRVPVAVDATTGQLLDGHHRRLIADELGIDCPTVEVAGLADGRDRAAYAIRVNLNRRHLSAEQRREVEKREKKLARQLSSDHTQEEIAKLLGRPQQTMECASIVGGGDSRRLIIVGEPPDFLTGLPRHTKQDRTAGGAK